MNKKNRHHPSGTAESLLRMLLPEPERHDLLGDYEEYYKEISNRKGRFIAELWYWLQILTIVPRNIWHSTQWSLVMIRNYIKISLRTMRKQKIYSLINICGLALGLTCFILIFLYVRFELSYDDFHTNGDRIYRFYKQRKGVGSYLGNSYFMTTPAPLAPALKQDYPEVVNATRLNTLDNLLISCRRNNYYEDGIYADSHFLKIFSFPLTAGSKETALAEPFSIVLSETIAEKMFGSENPLGRTIQAPSLEIDLKVTGILLDIPANSHIQFDFIVSFSSLEKIYSKQQLNRWSSSSYYTYVQLEKNTDPNAFEQKIAVFLDKYAPERYGEYAGLLQPLRKTHLCSHFNFDPAVTSDIKNIYLFSALAVIILIIACVNYMNLATARSSQRAKEVGLRKVVGAFRGEIIKQFLGDSILTALCAFFISLLLAKAVMPMINVFLGQEIPFELLGNPLWALSLIVIVFLVGLLSGSYPAIYLSAFEPVRVIKGNTGSFTKGSRLRNILVTFQFSISITLMIGTMIVYSQILFVKHKDPGFNNEHVVVISSHDRVIDQNMSLFKEQLEKYPNILGVTASWHLPNNIRSRSDVTVMNPDGDEITVSTYHSSVDNDFVDVFDIELISGRNFSRAFSTDPENAILVNETLAERIGWDEPVGKSFPLNRHYQYRIIGIMKDFHFQSYHREIEPMALHMHSFNPNYIFIKINPMDMSSTIAHIKAIYEGHNPHHPFDYSFLDEAFNRTYQTEQKLNDAFLVFSALAIFISALGLFGLASFTTEEKKKEIGLRKVLGASVADIVSYLSRGFTKWVAVANIVAWPIAYIAMNQWLQNFAYRTKVSIWVFILSGLAALIIALLTVSYQTIKAATANPIDSLHYE